jgi:DNA helicase-2/ATP-dependent DNA helicase PcrA
MSIKYTSFELFLQSELNDVQQEAVLNDAGPLLVIAGAGSGKTRVITARITHLIKNRSVSPSAIVALTFTNKAAQEMKERVASFLERSTYLPFIGTFHSYCLQLLKRNKELLESPFSSILDTDDQKKLISDILKKNNLHKQFNAHGVLYAISQLKNQNSDLATARQMMHPLIYDVYIAYEKEKANSHCYDFDDLLINTVKLFAKHPEFKQQHHRTVRHLLVDEYQDTNVVQHELLKHMAKSGNATIVDSLCAVGDEDQSIYSWRGATIANMLNFKKDFPETTLIKIEQNYRSVQPILHVANEVIKNNTSRNPKKLWSERPGSDRIRSLTCMSEYQEADAISQLVTAAQKKQSRQEIAVLYRTHAQSRAIEESFIKHSIPYRIIGGVQFYERKEIKDLLAYLRLVNNPFDRSALSRIINTPSRGLGEKFEEQLLELWHAEPFLNAFQVAEKCIDTGIASGKKGAAAHQFITLFKGLGADSTASAALDQIIRGTQYVTYLKDSYEKQDAETRIGNVQELVDAIAHFEEQKIATVEQFLDEVALLQDKLAASDDDQDKVVLMTLHAAKGLEFEIVIIAGLEEGLLPSSRSIKDDEALQEERRLFYVGITRAKERLLLTHAKYRYTYGQMVDQFQSRFLQEVPTTFSSHEECTYWRQPQLHRFFSDWLGIKQEEESVMTVADLKNLARKARKKNAIEIKQLFKQNQPVLHQKYGAGIIKEVEARSDGSLSVTVKFKVGEKKILSQFLEVV